MGQSIGGILFYGIPLGEDAPLPWDRDEEDWGDWYCEKMGLSYPIEPYDRNNPTFEDYYTKRRDLLKKLNIDFGFYGGEPHSIALVIKEANHYSDWGQEVEIISLDTKSEWDDQLKEFCNLIGVTYERPKWILTCYVG